jgi:integrase
MMANDRAFAAKKTLGPRIHAKRDELYDFIFFAVESMMRIGELRRLTVGQVHLIDEDKITDTPEHLLIDVVGKRGYRQTVVGGEALSIFKRRSKKLKPSDRLWTTSLREGFAALLKAANLETDSFGIRRNLKSLRPTGISFRVLAGMPNPDLVSIARAAGTSISQLNDFYLKRLTAQHGARTLAKSSIWPE